MTSRAEQAWFMALESLDVAIPDRVRPGVRRWLWYCVWGPLPARHAGWVLHDTTCSTWVLRHFVRVLVTITVPVLALVFLLPASGGLRALTAVVAGGCALLFGVIWSNEATDSRLQQAGYPYALGGRLRARRAEIAQQWSNW